MLDVAAGAEIVRLPLAGKQQISPKCQQNLTLPNYASCLLRSGSLF